jgi:inosine-uridine nucleoside N-ribohydrolase
LQSAESAPAAFLRRTVPFGFRTTAGLYGTEGFYLQDVLGIVAVARPDALTTRPAYADVETRGDLTRGMSVFDTRWGTKAKPNVELVTSVDTSVVRKYIAATVGQA